MPKIIKALIVDDERLARREIISLLSSYPCIRIIAEAADVPSAIQAVTEHTPDVIFLDIQMPGVSGFDLIDAIPPSIRIIFVTAFDEYAIRAFEVNALDYLLKPVHPERLRLAVERLCNDAVSPKHPDHRLEYDDRLFLLLNTQHRFLKIDSILCITAAGDYSEVIVTDGAKWLTSKTLREWESRLPEKHFCRIHRSVIINMNSIDRTEEMQNQSCRIYLLGIAEPFILSRRYSALLKDRLR
jgi:two-component system, LytTR family, response regulator